MPPRQSQISSSAEMKFNDDEIKACACIVASLAILLLPARSRHHNLIAKVRHNDTSEPRARAKEEAREKAKENMARVNCEKSMYMSKVIPIMYMTNMLMIMMNIAKMMRKTCRNPRRRCLHHGPWPREARIPWVEDPRQSRHPLFHWED